MSNLENTNESIAAEAELSASVLGVAMRTPGYSGFAEIKAGKKIEESPESFVGSLGEFTMSPRERRRAPVSVLLSLDVAAQALTDASVDPSQVVAVFASGVGDADTMNQLYKTVSSDDKQVSPTVFHNSVHNAASGYWTIGNQCQQAVSFVSADEYSFSMALLEAVTLTKTQALPVLMVVSDVVSPEPLAGLHGVSDTFAMALVLTQPSDSQSQLQKIKLTVADGATAWPLFDNGRDEDLAELYKSNAAARALSLLQNLGQDSAPAELCLPLSEYASLQLS